MCGINGALQADLTTDAWEMALGRMATALTHRGPDASGTWCDPEAGIGFAHRRLSILDLSPTGHQPMASADGRYWITYNGEIYNFRALRQELEAFGMSIRGSSDTEVILAAISRWGLVPAVERLVGMFAFGLWDRQTRQLHLVRDRFGEKPLYYGWIGEAFVFGSELKALKAHPLWRGEINRDALTLLMRYNCIPAPYSIYRGISKLEPGKILTITADPAPGRGRAQSTTYWSTRDMVERGVANPLACSIPEGIGQLDALLTEAVGLQMVADVPLGAFLSGGIDSSTIVALMQAQSSQPAKTFTIGFDEENYNEATHARAIAQHLGTEHTELLVTPHEAQEVIPRLPTLFDEPFSDSSQIPTFLVAQLARRHVTVSLSGDAGDEIFGGYNRYHWGQTVWSKIGHWPRGLRRVLGGALQSVSPKGWNQLYGSVEAAVPAHLRLAAAGDKVHKFAGALHATSLEDLYLKLVTHWDPSDGLVLGANEPSSIPTDRARWAALDDFTECMMYLDTVSYLPDDILIKVDRACMGVSLESRVPFLDHRVVEFAWRIPLAWKLHKGQGKWILRRVLDKYVPRELIDRPKMGFGVPIGTWLRGPLRGWAEGLLDPVLVRKQGLLDPAPIAKKWAEHLAGTHNWQHHLWDVLMLQAWLAENEG